MRFYVFLWFRENRKDMGLVINADKTVYMKVTESED